MTGVPLPPERGYVAGKIWFDKPPRAVADAARSLVRFDDVRPIVCAAVQQRACTVAELTEELEAGPAVGAGLVAGGRSGGGGRLPCLSPQRRGSRSHH
jgi:hypothetical protein